MFIAALFTIARTWKQPKCPSTEDWIKKTWYIYTMECSAAAAKSLQSCPTLSNPIDGSPPGSAVPGILQARTLEWVAIFFSNEWKWKVKVKSLSRIQLFATPWTAAYQAPPSMGFSRREYWSGLPSPSPMECYSAIKRTKYCNAICKNMDRPRDCHTEWVSQRQI